MDGEPARHRYEPSEVEEEDYAGRDQPARRPVALPIATLAIGFGLAAAAVAVICSGVLSPAGDSGGFTGNWRLSAGLVAAIAAGWFAGLLHLLAYLLPNSGPRGSAAPMRGWRASLAAFAAGPLLVALFFFGTGLARFPASDFAAWAIAGGIVLVLLFARHGIRLLAERLLISFFLWMLILVAPTFWRDPVSEEMASFLFGLLNAAGLLG